MREDEYLDALIQSLKKKTLILNKISVLDKEQAEILQDARSAPEALEANMRAKDDLVSQINKLDEGFEEVYGHIKDLMERDHAEYEAQLEQMRDCIRQIMELDAKVRAEEQANYELARQRFADVRRQAREIRAGRRAVDSYYKNMMHQDRYAPQYMDKKK